MLLALSFRIPHSLRGAGPYGPYGPEADFRILLYLPLLYLSAFRIPHSDFRIPHSLRGVGPYGPYGPEADFRILLCLPSLFHCPKSTRMKLFNNLTFILYFFFKNGQPFADVIDPMGITAAGPRKAQFFGHLTGHIVLIR
jgi:hypothetical protein